MGLYQPTQYQPVMKKKPSPWGGILAKLLTSPLVLIPGVGGALHGAASSGLQSATGNMGMGAKYGQAPTSSPVQNWAQIRQQRQSFLDQWLPPLA